MKPNPEEKLAEAVAEVNKRFGKGTLLECGQSTASDVVDAISTGNAKIDALTGIGGIPKGRITEIYGPESAGKTTLTLQIIAEAQKAGGRAVFIDMEHALNIEYAKKLGVDTDKLLVTQPFCGEDALEIAQTMVQSGVVSIVVVDSVAALVPRAELEGDMGDPTMGLQARLMSQAMRKLNGSVSTTKSSLTFVNQVRDKIGQMWGNPETTTGGRALKFYSSLRISVRRVSSKKKGDVVIGNETKVRIEKNKMFPPYREDLILLKFGEGFKNE